MAKAGTEVDIQNPQWGGGGQRLASIGKSMKEIRAAQSTAYVKPIVPECVQRARGSEKTKLEGVLVNGDHTHP